MKLNLSKSRSPKISVSILWMGSVLGMFTSASAQAAELQLANNAPFAKEVYAALPRETVIVSFAGGASLIPKEKQGITSVLSDIFDEGPQGTRPDDFRKKLFLMNAAVGLSSDTRAMHLSVTAPQETLPAALALAAQTLEKLKLNSAEFGRSKAKVFAGRKASEDNMAYVARYFAFRNFFNYQPDTLTGEGSAKTIGGLSLGDVQKFAPQLLNKTHAFYTSAGPVPLDNVKVEIEKNFLQKPANFAYVPVKFEKAKILDATAGATAGALPEAKVRPVTVINKKGATDNQVMMVLPLEMKRDGPEALDAEVVHEILGGGLSSRLGKTLRVERGLTYHASSFVGSKLPVWGVYTFGGLFQTEDLLKGIDEVVEKFKAEKVPESDIREAVESAVTGHLESTELPSDRLFEKIRYRLYGLDVSFFENYLVNVSAVNAERVQAFQQKKVITQGGHLYIMGDKTKLLPILKKLGHAEKNVRVVEVSDIE